MSPWVGFGLGMVNLLLWCAVGFLCAKLYRKAKPALVAFAPMLQPFASATGGDAKAAASAAASAAVAPPDPCEYGEHVWSAPTSYADGISTHYCKACGYTEQTPGA